MSVDKSAESFEGSDSSTPTSYDSMVSEANAGREELYDAQNKMTEEIKLGRRRSGITDEFGKPIFFDTEDTQIGIPAGEMESAVPLDASIGIPAGQMESAVPLDASIGIPTGEMESAVPLDASIGIPAGEMESAVPLDTSTGIPAGEMESAVPLDTSIGIPAGEMESAVPLDTSIGIPAGEMESAVPLDTSIGIPAGEMESAVPLDTSIGIPAGEMESAVRLASYTRSSMAGIEGREQPAPPVDQDAMTTVADGIFFACAGMGTDEDTIYKLLEGRTRDEIAAINSIYQERYGLTLEEQFNAETSGAYKEKAISLLDGTYSDAERVHTALLERADWNVMGRTNAACEKDIRDTISTMNSEQIAQLDKEYRAKHGVGIREALLDDPNLSDATKQALEIYLKGTDQRTDEDTQKLAEISMYAPPDMSVDMFQEAFRDASPEARRAFMESPAGQTLDLLAASGITIYEGMRDYARDGHLSTATKIYSTDTWLGDNEVAIEQTLSSMSAEERQAYLRGKELAATGADQAGLSEEDRQALETYREVRGALEAVGNTTELARWEDMIANPGGSLVARLAEHAGTIYDSGMQDVLSDIENMSQEDWERLKNDPAYRGEIEGVLKTYLSEAELARATSILDKKAAAESYEESLQLGRRPVLDAIADNTGYFSNDERAIVEAVSHMTPDEQKRYREDPEFKRQVDEALASALQPGPELDAARHLLDKVERGEGLKMDIVSELSVRAGEVDETGHFIARGPLGALFPSIFGATEQELRDNAQARDMLTGTRAAGVVGELEKAFKEDPTLRDRLTNPQTDEDRRMAEEFDLAVRRSVSDADYDTYIKPLLETGQLPIDKRMELHQSLTDVDEQAVYEDMLSATPEERERLLNDPEYQQEVLGFLSSYERQVALNVLEQGEIRPEDIIYLQTLGLGTGEEEIKAALKDLSPEELERARSEYARKYGSDLTYDLLSELGGQDQLETVRDARRAPESDREAFNQARDEFYESRDGLGKQLVDATWDGTGYMADDALNRYAGAMSEYSARFEELPPEKQRELTEQIQTSLDLFRESKGSAADAVVDTAIAAVAVGGAFFTDGVSLGLLAATGFGAAMFKVGAKSAIMGSDYDWNSSQVAVDFTTGFVDGALSFVGPGEIATIFKVGDNAALAAGEKVLARGGGELIAGGEEALDAALTEAVRDSIVNGSYKIDDAGLDRLVAQVAKEGATDAEKAQLKQLIKESLSESLDAESRSALERIGTEYALNMGAGALGGGASGTVRGIAEWDTNASFEENMARLGTAAGAGAGFGGAGAAGFTTVFKAGSVVYRGVRGVDVPEAPAGTAGEPGTTVDVRTGKPASASDALPVVDQTPTGEHMPELAELSPQDLVALERRPEVAITSPTAKTREYSVDGDATRLVEKGGWFYPEKPPGTKTKVDYTLKVHVATTDSADLARLQEVLIPALKNDPELAALVQDWKTMDPHFGAADNVPPGWTIGEGQGEKAFTLYVANPEDAFKLQQKLDEVLAQHPELKLDQPANPNALDQFGGTTNRVGIVRDFYEATELGSDVPIPMDIRTNLEAILQKAPGEKFSDTELRVIEDKMGLMIDYDEAGNLMVRETGARLDDNLSAAIHQSFGLGRGEKLSADQLGAVETRVGLAEGTLVYDKEGKLALKGTVGGSRLFSSKEQLGDALLVNDRYYLTEAGAESLPRGIYLSEEGAVEMGGLTDRPALYRLSEEFGIHPVDDFRPPSASDGVKPGTDAPASAPLESAPPATDAVPRTAADEVLWNPERNLIRLSEAQKAEFNELARGSDLYKTEAVDSFAERSLATMAKWDDVSSLSRDYESSLAVMEQAQSKLRSRLPEGVGIWPVERARQALSGDPEGLKLLEDTVAAAETFKRTSQELKLTVAERQGELQRMMDEYADAQGLPRVKVVVQDDKFLGAAAARYLDGTVQLRTSDVLSARNTAELVGSMYHEFAHSEQDFLMIRAMADELGIGQEATFREFNQLVSMYDQQIGSALPRDQLEQRLRQALEKRDGYHLSPDQTERAHELIDSFKNNAPVGDEYSQAGDSFRMAQRDLALLEKDGGSYELIEQIAENKKHAEHLFGSEIPPEVEELIDLYQRKQAGENIAWPDEAATQVLEHQLRERMASINADRQARYERYMAGRHEREALVLGERARLMADEILQEQEDELTEFIADAY